MWSMADKIWCYHWGFQKWTIIPVVSSIIFSGVTKAVSIDEDYPPDMTDDTNIDGAGLPTLDDPVFKGGAPLLYVFNSSRELGEFSGTPMAAKFTGTELEMFRGQRACLRMARPDTDAVAGLTLTLRGKQRLGDAGSSTAFNSLTTSGDMPLRFSARFIRPSFQIAAGTTWTYAKGLDFVGEPGAGR
jgi:hypothetical protein